MGHRLVPASRSITQPMLQPPTFFDAISTNHFDAVNCITSPLSYDGVHGRTAIARPSASMRLMLRRGASVIGYYRHLARTALALRAVTGTDGGLGAVLGVDFSSAPWVHRLVGSDIGYWSSVARTRWADYKTWVAA